MCVTFSRVGIAVVLAFVSSPPLLSSAAVVWNESTNGDLSGNRLAPSSIALSPGTNSVAGSMSFTDKEYFTVVIPDNHEFTALELANFAGGDSVAFIGVQSGTQMTVPPNAEDATGLLGWTHFADSQMGEDLLPDIGVGGLGATNFTPPLPSGAYTFWVQVQQIDGLLVTYQLDFAVAAIGDNNGDWVVNAADYVAGRKGLAPFDYEAWRTHFGETPDAGSGGSATVPEPASALISVVIVLGMPRLRSGRPTPLSADR